MKPRRTTRARLRSIPATGLGPMTRGNAGHFDTVRPFELEVWKGMGEAGQLLAGNAAGFTINEVAAKRGWSELQKRLAVEVACRYLKERSEGK